MNKNNLLLLAENSKVAIVTRGESEVPDFTILCTTVPAILSFSLVLIYFIFFHHLFLGIETWTGDAIK